MIPLSKLTGETVADLQEVTTGTPGNVDLHFCIYDDEDTMQSQTVEMRSRIKKISMGKNLVRFLKEHDEFRYQIN